MVLSVAAVAPSANGYFTVFPCGTPKPLASSMNFTKGVTLANTVITKLGAGGVNAGKVCVYSNVTTNLVIDVTGSLTPAAFAALSAPQRIVDSRNPAGDTDDEQQERLRGPRPAAPPAPSPSPAGSAWPVTSRTSSSSVAAVSPAGPTGSSPSTPAAPPDPWPPA